ncbi:MAG TPA: S53 family serine peptidase [Candidatus Acidoferrum sp.]|nr:S53 family serine peptidase [Candidatus Acidoferrum sp.]
MNLSMNQSGGIGAVAIVRATCVALSCAMLLFSAGTKAQEQSMPTRHIHQEMAGGQAKILGHLPETQQLKLNIALPLRNEAELDDLLRRLYDPKSGLYHQFLSVEEFTARFGPTEQDYTEAARFAEEKGLKVTGTYENRMVLNVTGSVGNIEKALHVKMNSYKHPTDNRAFYSADREPAPELGIKLWHITGLDNFSIPQPAGLKRDAQAPPHTTGSGPSGYFLGSDFRAAYYGGTALTGAGQSVGLLEFAGYNQADVTKYFSTVGQPLTVRVVGVSTDGSSLSCSGGCDDTEQVLDIEVAISMAPGMNQVRVYVSDTSDVSMFNKMASENLAKSLSCSWGWSPADPSSDDPIFKEFAAQGQNLFVASGDSGAYRKKSRYVYPADDAFVTSVGGTDLVTASPGGPWQSETAWNGSGGGISPNGIAIPTYQKAGGVITTGNKGSTTLRNAPDVAAEGNTDNFICYDGKCAGGWGGTSFAAPRWAGYLALVNQQSVSHGHATAGFLNPTIYSIGLGSSYGADFHDITSGSNGTYSTIKSYDLVTGWGSPIGAALINALAP